MKLINLNFAIKYIHHIDDCFYICSGNNATKFKNSNIMKQKNEEIEVLVSYDELEYLELETKAIMCRIESSYGSDFDDYPELVQRSYLTYGSILAKVRDSLKVFDK